MSWVSKGSTVATYRVKLHPDVRSDLAGLAKEMQRQAAKQLRKLAIHPQAGKTLGHRAGYDLTGYRALSFAGKRFRIVYRLNEEVQEVLVVAVARRARFEAYRLAARRAGEEA